MPLPKVYKKAKKQRMACFRMSEPTIDMLTRLSELSGHSRTMVVELLIIEEMKLVDKVFAERHPLVSQSKLGRKNGD